MKRSKVFQNILIVMAIVAVVCATGVGFAGDQKGHCGEGKTQQKQCDKADKDAEGCAKKADANCSKAAGCDKEKARKCGEAKSEDGACTKDADKSDDKDDTKTE